jgi:hypothetical protein
MTTSTAMWAVNTVVDPRPGYRHQHVELDPVSDAVRQLRRLASRLASEHHPLAHVPQQVANTLVDVRAPAPKPAYHPVPGMEAEFAQSPTGTAAAATEHCRSLR